MPFSKTDFRYWSTRVKKRRSGTWESSDYHVSVTWRGVGPKWVNLLTANKGYAAKRAVVFWEALVSQGWVAAHCAISGPAAVSKLGLTIGQFLDAVQEGSSISPITFTYYSRKFRTIASEILVIPAPSSARGKEGASAWRKKIDGFPLAVITPDKVHAWKLGRLKGIQEPVRLSTAKRTVNNYIRNAKSLFARKHLKFLQLPAPLPQVLPFDEVEFESGATKQKFKGEINVEWILNQAKEELGQMSAPFIILVLGLMTGMRRGEIDKLQWSQVFFGDRPFIRIEETDCMAPKHGSSRDINIDESVAAWLNGLRSESESRFVVAGVEPRNVGYTHYRCDKYQRELITWLRRKGVKSCNPIHMLRAEAGSQINQLAGIHAASAFLGHADIRLTNSTYVDNRRTVTIGLPVAMD